MTDASFLEAEPSLGSLLDRIERGEEIVITRNGSPVARLVPYPGQDEQNQARAAFQRIRERAGHLKRDKSEKSFDWPALKKLRDQR
jgi:prevent-host-death family protein